MNGAVVKYRFPLRGAYQKCLDRARESGGATHRVIATECERTTRHSPALKRPDMFDPDRVYIDDPYGYFRPDERTKASLAAARNAKQKNAKEKSDQAVTKKTATKSSSSRKSDSDRFRQSAKTPIVESARSTYVMRKLHPFLTQDMIDNDGTRTIPFFNEHKFKLAPNEPHDIVFRHFSNIIDKMKHNNIPEAVDLELDVVVPHWSICPFEECTQVSLYLGFDHPYVWYPRDIRDEDQSLYTVYCSLVSRIDFTETLLGITEISHEIRRHIVMIQDAMMYMVLFMDLSGRYDDASLLRPATFEEYIVMRPATSNESRYYESDERSQFVMPPKLYSHFSLLNRVIDEARASATYDTTNRRFTTAAAAAHVPTYYDVFKPSYELIFHYGELPDIQSIAQYLGIYSKVNKNSTPEWDEEIDRVVELWKKAGLESMKLRAMHNTTANKIHESELVNDCQIRLLFATLGGYYPDFTKTCGEPSTSFYVRKMLYDWLSFRPPSSSEFRDWFNGHYVNDPTGAYKLVATHKKITLFVVKEALFRACIDSNASLRKIMELTYQYIDIRRDTYSALADMRQTLDNCFFGVGPRWESFQRMSDEYYLVYQRKKLSSIVEATHRASQWWLRRVIKWQNIDTEAFFNRMSAAPSEYVNPNERVVKIKPEVVAGIPCLPKPISKKERSDDDAQLEAIGQQLMKEAEESERENSMYIRDKESATEHNRFEDPSNDHISAAMEFERRCDEQSQMYEEAKRRRAKRGARLDAWNSWRTNNKPSLDRCHVRKKRRTGYVNEQMNIAAQRVLVYTLEFIAEYGREQKVNEDLPRMMFEELFASFEQSKTWFARRRWENELRDSEHVVVEWTVAYVISMVYANKMKRCYGELAIQFDQACLAQIWPTIRARSTIRDARAKIRNAMHKLIVYIWTTCRVGPKECRNIDELHRDPERMMRLAEMYFSRYAGVDDVKFVQSDYRYEYYPLHGRMIVESKGSQGCSCSHCDDSIDNYTAYRRFQDLIASGAYGKMVLNSTMLEIIEYRLVDTYSKSLEMMYRAPSNTFVSEVVRITGCYSAINKDNDAFARARVSITPGERYLIAGIAERFPWYDPPSVRWMPAYPLMANSDAISTFMLSTFMYKTHTYPVDVANVLKGMAEKFPREYCLIEQFYHELHINEKVQIYRLSLHATQQQIRTAHEMLNAVGKDELLPETIGMCYYCDVHGTLAAAYVDGHERANRSHGKKGASSQDHREGAGPKRRKHKKNKSKGKGVIYERNQTHIVNPKNLRAIGAIGPPNFTMLAHESLPRCFQFSQRSRAKAGGMIQQMRFNRENGVDGMSSMDSTASDAMSHDDADDAWLLNGGAAFDDLREFECYQDESFDEDEDAFRMEMDISKKEDQIYRLEKREKCNILCKKPMRRINMIGVLLSIDGRIYALCVRCLTPVRCGRYSIRAEGPVCRLCTYHIDNMRITQLIDTMRYVCSVCEKQFTCDNVARYEVYDNISCQHTPCVLYLCKKHNKAHICTTMETSLMGHLVNYLLHRTTLVYPRQTSMTNVTMENWTEEQKQDYYKRTAYVEPIFIESRKSNSQQIKRANAIASESITNMVFEYFSNNDMDTSQHTEVTIEDDDEYTIDEGDGT